MQCELVCDYKFESAHWLPKVPETHKCHRMHGHSYQVKITVAGDVDPALGWLIDFADVDDVVKPVIARLDHRILNNIEGLENPTCEYVARWLWDAIKPSLTQLSAITVSETRNARCVYRG